MKITKTRYIACVAIFSAIAFVLMLLDFPITAIIPSFVKFDFSELPALLASFSLGPIAGIIVCFIKNLIHFITMTTTNGVGELANFLLGAVFSGSAGFIYKYKKNKLFAFISCIVGSFLMAIISFPINLFITYPFYYNFMPKEVIINMYQAIFKNVDSIEECLLLFNTPFNLLKGIATSIITFILYKPLSPLIKGYHNKNKQKILEDEIN